MTSAVAAASSLNIQVFTQKPGKSFTGMVPAYLSDIAKLDDDSIVGCFKMLNKMSLKTASWPLETIVKGGRLATITYDNGKIKSICVDHLWVEKLVKEKANGVILSYGGREFSCLGNVGIAKISTESYNKMAKLCVPLLIV